MASPSVSALKDRLAAVKADLQRNQAGQNLRNSGGAAVMSPDTRGGGILSGATAGNNNFGGTSRLFTTPPPEWRPATSQPTQPYGSAPDGDGPSVIAAEQRTITNAFQTPLREEVVRPPMSGSGITSSPIDPNLVLPATSTINFPKATSAVTAHPPAPQQLPKALSPNQAALNSPVVSPRSQAVKGMASPGNPVVSISSHPAGASLQTLAAQGGSPTQMNSYAAANMALASAARDPVGVAPSLAGGTHREDEIYRTLAKTGGVSKVSVPTSPLMNQVIADLQSEAELKHKARQGEQATVDAAKAILQMEVMLQEKNAQLENAHQRIQDLEAKNSADVIEKARELEQKLEEAVQGKQQAEEELEASRRSEENERRAHKVKLEALEQQLEELVTQLENSVHLSKEKQQTIELLQAENSSLRTELEQSRAEVDQKDLELAESKALLEDFQNQHQTEKNNHGVYGSPRIGGNEVRFARGASPPKVVRVDPAPVNQSGAVSSSTAGVSAGSPPLSQPRLSRTSDRLSSPTGSSLAPRPSSSSLMAHQSRPAPTTHSPRAKEPSVATTVQSAGPSASMASVSQQQQGTTANGSDVGVDRTMKRLGNLEAYLLAMSQEREEDKTERRKLLSSMAQMQTSLSEVTSTVCRLVASNPPAPPLLGYGAPQSVAASTSRAESRNASPMRPLTSPSSAPISPRTGAIPAPTAAPPLGVSAAGSLPPTGGGGHSRSTSAHSGLSTPTASHLSRETKSGGPIVSPRPAGGGLR